MSGNAGAIRSDLPGGTDGPAGSRSTAKCADCGSRLGGVPGGRRPGFGAPLTRPNGRPRRPAGCRPAC